MIVSTTSTTVGGSDGDGNDDDDGEGNGEGGNEGSSEGSASKVMHKKVKWERIKWLVWVRGDFMALFLINNNYIIKILKNT